MGNSSSKKKRIKGTGEGFNAEKYEINDEKLKSEINKSFVRYDSNIIISRIKSDPYEDYKVLKTLGEGAFGKVELVEHKVTGMIRAMKILKKINESNEEMILNELKTLIKIDHQNIIKIYEYYCNKDNYYLITEYCSGGDLFNVMKKENLSEIQVACIMFQILLALNHIHKMNIMHRDLKLENILVTKKENDGLYRIKICDFGTSHLFELGKKEKIIAGSSYYMAPEVLKQKYNFKCDLWSCGVIMYILLTKKIPFLGVNEKEIEKNIKKKGYNPGPLESFSQYVKDLIDNLMEREPTKRLNAEKALQYNIFTVYKCKEKINKMDLNEIKIYINNIKEYKRGNILQETAMSYLVHNSDLEEISGPLKLFNMLDKNENGEVGFVELYNGLNNISGGSNFNEEEIKEIFLNLDTNNNGFFEQEEFVKAAIDKKIYLSEKMIKFAFNFFDKDKSGLITIDEIMDLFKANIEDKENAYKEFQKLISSFDKNSDKEINLEEFSLLMKNLFA